MPKAATRQCEVFRLGENSQRIDFLDTNSTNREADIATAAKSRADELFGLSGKAAVVTGANRGIGRGIALELGRLGAKIVVASRDPVSGEAVAKEIRDEGGQAIRLPFELRDEASVKTLMESAKKEHGAIDILVNNAGIYPVTSPFLETTAEQWDNMNAVNLRGTFFCIREGARIMRENGGGNIVNISSMGSLRPAAPTRFAYNSSKAGLNRLTQDAAAEFARDKIRVNAVLPGPISLSSAPIEDPAIAKMQELILKKIAVRRFGTPADIAAAVAFLVSPASSFITGQMILADGGFTLK
ncbi:MAG: SDR family NAD(P)-dependent oxidoreductase [Caulobacterales bacterium]